MGQCYTEIINYKIYFLYDKRFFTPDDKKWPSNSALYIGLTKNPLQKRLREHFKEARKTTHQTKKLNWIRKVGEENINIELVEENIPNINKAAEREVYYIKWVKECLGLSDFLKNGDAGGFGSTKNYTEETIEKIRKSKLGNKWNVGRDKSEETRKKLSEAHKGKPKSPEAIEKGRQTYRRNRLLGLNINKSRRFSEEDVIQIFKMANAGSKNKDIAEYFKCSVDNIGNVLYKNSYTDISEKLNLNLILKRNGLEELIEAGRKCALQKKEEARIRNAERKRVKQNQIQQELFNIQKLLYTEYYYLKKIRKFTNKEIADMYQKHPDSIRRILENRSWGKKFKNYEPDFSMLSDSILLLQ